MSTKVTEMGQIRKQMFILGYNQNRLAEIAGVSREMVSKVFRGHKLPSPKLSKALAEALEMDVKEFRAALLVEKVS